MFHENDIRYMLLALTEAKIAAETDLVIYSGNDDIIVPIMSIGGKGVVFAGK